MSIRTVTKALAGIQDLLLGNEIHSQIRGGSAVDVQGLSAESLPMAESTSPTLSQLLKYGTGSPEGAVTANPGTMYLNQSGGASATLYVKETGTGNTGWVAK